MSKLRIISIFLVVIYIFACAPLCSAEEPESITVEARAALLADLDTDTFLLSQNVDEKMYPASLTKIMTVLLAIENGNLDDELTATESALSGLSIYGSSVYLQEGEVMTLRDLLYCTMVASANEACNVIAEYISGSVSSFVDLMNRKAEILGCENTHFVNPHGLHDDNHYTTARDIYTIIKEALKYDVFREICRTASVEIPPTNLYSSRYLKTTNYLLSEQTVEGYYYEYARGIKTGTTSQAGICLASYAEKDGVTLVSVVLGCESVQKSDGGTDLKNFSETKRMFEWGFENFAPITLISTSDPVAEIPISMAADTDSIIVHSDADILAVLPKNYDIGQLEKDITIFYDDDEQAPSDEESPQQTLVAPVTEGETVGTMTVYYNDEPLGTVNLIALTSVERSQVLYRFDKIKAFFTQSWVQFAMVGMMVMFLIVGITIISYTVKQQKQRRTLGSTYKGSSLKKPR